MHSYTTGRDTEQAAIVCKTARITGKTPRYIRMVIAGERQNAHVLDVYMLFQEGNEVLLQEATKLNRQVRKHAA